MKTRYTCPQCGNAVTLHVTPSQPPTCYNPNKHTGKRIDMTPDITSAPPQRTPR
jgi:hypothetical protein